MIDITTDYTLADPLATETVEVCDFSDPAIVSFTDQFVGLKKNLNISSTDMVIRMGEVLIAVRPHLENCYYAWLETVGISSSTAHNYVQLKNFAEENPTFINTWKDLGPAKLYRVIALPANQRDSVMTDDRHDEFVRMSCREFDAYVSGTDPVTVNVDPSVNEETNVLSDGLVAVRDSIRLLDSHLHAFGGDVMSIVDPQVKDQFCAEVDHLILHLTELKQFVAT